jgi:hypothetical protein
MSYFIFIKSFEDSKGSLYRIAENQSDLNNLNIFQTDYKIIEDSIDNFNAVKYSTKIVLEYNLNTIIYMDQINSFDKNSLQKYINDFKKEIKNFTDNNLNHPLFGRWSNYYTQLSNLNLDNINYPLNMSLEQYFNELGQTSLNPLQIP